MLTNYLSISYVQLLFLVADFPSSRSLLLKIYHVFCMFQELLRGISKW